MRVLALYRYPVKSLGGASVDALHPRERGFADDRRWMLVDPTGRFITRREHPQLARFAAETFGDSGLRVREITSGEIVWEQSDARPALGDGRPVTVWDDDFTAAEVSGSAPLAERLGIAGARLVYMPAESLRPVDQRYAETGETVSFADGFPYLLTTSASLEDLSARFGRPLDMLRFRPNIVVDGDAAYAEDRWAALRVGDHRFVLPKPCARCVMITQDPETGEGDPAVMATLAAYRKRGNKILFGENALWRGGDGPLRVGDQVSVEAYR